MEKVVVEEFIKILGKKNVLLEKSQLYAYSFDAAYFDGNVHLPEAVLLPEFKEQVVKILKIADKHNIKVVARASGTNHCGACVALEGGIVIHFSKMDKIIKIDADNLMAKVEPGVAVGKLQDEAEKLGLFFPPDPSNLKVSTIGGAIALSSGGSKTFKYGTIKDYVLDLEVALIDGSVIRTGSDTIKNVAGYNLTQLFVGSEGTLGITLEATLRLKIKPEYKMVMLAYFKRVEDLVNASNSIISNGIEPCVIDYLDNNTLQAIENYKSFGFDLDCQGALLIELDGFKSSVEEQLKRTLKILEKNNVKNITESKNQDEYDKIWQARRCAYAAQTAFSKSVVSEDVVVPRTSILKLLEGIDRILDKYSLKACILGHIADGNIHPNFIVDMEDERDRQNLAKAKEELFNLAVSLNGSISGEHGVGYDKSKYLPLVLNENTISSMKKIKTAFDPKGLLNPRKIWE